MSCHIRVYKVSLKICQASLQILRYEGSKGMLQTTMKRPVKTIPNPTQQDLALRLRHAMEESDVSLTQLAKECGVTPQAIYDWRSTGRIGKQHLVTIARVTRKPLEYFLVGLRAAMLLLALTFAAPQPSEAAPFWGAKGGALYIMLNRVVYRLRAFFGWPVFCVSV